MDAIRENGHRGCRRPSGGQDYCDDPEAATAGDLIECKAAATLSKLLSPCAWMRKSVDMTVEC